MQCYTRRPSGMFCAFCNAACPTPCDLLFLSTACRSCRLTGRTRSWQDRTEPPPLWTCLCKRLHLFTPMQSACHAVLMCIGWHMGAVQVGVGVAPASSSCSLARVCVCVCARTEGMTARWLVRGQWGHVHMYSGAEPKGACSLIDWHQCIYAITRLNSAACYNT